MEYKNFEVALQKKSALWYVHGVNINYSFKTLEKIMEKMGANPNSGDIIIVDNIKRDRRKIMKKTISGFIMLYAYITSKGSFFEPIKTKKGRVENKKSVLDVLAH